jgi:ABC-2 type transport system permease protein
VLWARAALPPFVAPVGGDVLAGLERYAGQLLDSGPLPYLLMPFRLMVAPYFAANFGQFFRAIGPALLIIGLHYWWVVRSNVAFEEASVDLSQKTAERVSAMRLGRGLGARAPKKAGRPPFVLQPVGNPLMAVFWKNLISAGHFVTGRAWLMLLWPIIFGGIILKSQFSHGSGLGAAVASLAGMLTAMSLISGPQILRHDLRQDLQASDVLKMFPMRGWQIMLGEVLAPTAMLAGAQWLLLVTAAIFFPSHFGQHLVSLAARLSFALAAAVVLPFVDLMAMLIPNAAVLFFPAWFQLGKEAPRGFETTGQQLILMFGQMLALMLSLLAPAGVSAVIFFGGSYFVGNSAGVVLAGIAAAFTLAVEAGLAIKLLGGVFERFDLSSEVL